MTGGGKGQKMRWVRPGLSAAAAGLALALSGCAHAAPGVVAYVGDATISQRQLDEAVAGISTTLQPGQQVSSEAVVNVLIQGIIADQVAQQRHLVITDAQRDTLIRSSNLVGLLAVPAALPVAYDVADAQLVSKQVGSADYLAAIKDTRVTLNPRYGVLDPTQKTIVTDQSSSLSKPGANPSAPPPP